MPRINSPKGVIPPQLVPHYSGEKKDARLAKARATRMANHKAREAQITALKNAALIEQRLRKTSGAGITVSGAQVLDQFRRTAIMAIELADQKARESGHVNGLADLLAADLMRKPTETMSAWSKFLPAATAASESNTVQHLEAVRALTLATSAASRAAEIAADLVKRDPLVQIEAGAIEIEEIHRVAMGDCDQRKTSSNNGEAGEVVNTTARAGAEGAPEGARERASGEAIEANNSATTGPLPSES